MISQPDLLHRLEILAANCLHNLFGLGDLGVEILLPGLESVAAFDRQQALIDEERRPTLP